jgi:integrin-linked kinase
LWKIDLTPPLLLLYSSRRAGVSVNATDYDKRTALHLAASEGHVLVVEGLLAWHADVNAVDRMVRPCVT